MANTIQLKRGNAADWTSSDPTLAAGEFGYETDTGKFKVGDGSTAWSSLSYFEAAAAAVFTFQGESFGYSSGGTGTLPAQTTRNTIQKYSFTSDENATDVGDLLSATSLGSGQSSSENGYHSGGATPSLVNVIQKFPFATDANAADVGDLLSINTDTAGCSSSENGYSVGGQQPSSTYKLTTEKFPFAADENSTAGGDLLAGWRTAAGHSSPSHGYISGGYEYPNLARDTIQKFSFAADDDATDVGDLLFTVVSNDGGGSNSSTHGYLAGGYSPSSSSRLNTIQKFSFAADENATDVANLLAATQQGSSSSSTSSGYLSGGFQGPPNTILDTIQKFSFESDANSTDVANLAVAVRTNVAQQV